MDHLFHKNLLAEKHNLEWQLAEANKKIEQLQRSISSLQEKKQTAPTGNPYPYWKPFKNAPGYPEPIFKDGRWYSPNPNPPRPTELPKPRAPMDDWRWGGQEDWERPGYPGNEPPDPNQPD